MVTATDAVVQPLTVMIKPVDADIANVAVATTWQDYHLAGGANLPHIKLLEQVHKRDSLVVFDGAGAECLEDYTEEGPDDHQDAYRCFKPLTALLNDEREHEGHQAELGDEHRADIPYHSLAGAPDFMNWLLECECTRDPLEHRLVDLHRVFE